jgi:hypothetical protein
VKPLRRRLNRCKAGIQNRRLLMYRTWAQDISAIENTIAALRRRQDTLPVGDQWAMYEQMIGEYEAELDDAVAATAAENTDEE